MDSVDPDIVKSTAKVLQYVRDIESDSDHLQGLNHALDQLWDLHGSQLDVDTGKPNSEDVKRAFNLIEDNRDSKLGNAFRFVDRESRYVNGCLPSFRDWHVEYVHEGDVIEERVYDHEDEIPTQPEIDGLRYECDWTERGSGEVVVHVTEHPVRNDVDLVINAEGDDFINLESHNGPNISNPEEPIEILSQEFDWGMLGDEKIIVKDDPSDVVEFIEHKGWEFDRD